MSDRVCTCTCCDIRLRARGLVLPLNKSRPISLRVLRSHTGDVFVPTAVGGFFFRRHLGRLFFFFQLIKFPLVFTSSTEQTTSVWNPGHKKQMVEARQPNTHTHNPMSDGCDREHGGKERVESDQKCDRIVQTKKGTQEDADECEEDRGEKDAAVLMRRTLHSVVRWKCNQR